MTNTWGDVRGDEVGDPCTTSRDQRLKTGHRERGKWLAGIAAVGLLAVLGMSLFLGEVRYPTIRKKWSIAIYTGQTPFALAPAGGASSPELSARDITGAPAIGVADPFILLREPQWFLFFEVIRPRTRHGDIGWAESTDGRHWKYRGIALDEPFHLSYPYVFRWREEIYMIPESAGERAVRLYRATDFPGAWEPVKVLLSGRDYADASVMHTVDLHAEGSGDWIAAVDGSGPWPYWESWPWRRLWAKDPVKAAPGRGERHP